MVIVKTVEVVVQGEVVAVNRSIGKVGAFDTTKAVGGVARHGGRAKKSSGYQLKVHTVTSFYD